MRSENEKDDEVGFGHPFNWSGEQVLWSYVCQQRIRDYNGTTYDALKLCKVCYEEQMYADKIRFGDPGVHTNQECARNWFDQEFEGVCELLNIEYTWARRKLGWTDEKGWPEKLIDRTFREVPQKHRGHRPKASSNNGLPSPTGSTDGTP